MQPKSSVSLRDYHKRWRIFGVNSSTINLLVYSSTVVSILKCTVLASNHFPNDARPKPQKASTIRTILRCRSKMHATNMYVIIVDTSWCIRLASLSFQAQRHCCPRFLEEASRFSALKRGFSCDDSMMMHWHQHQLLKNGCFCGYFCKIQVNKNVRLSGMLSRPFYGLEEVSKASEMAHKDFLLIIVAS